MISKQNLLFTIAIPVHNGEPFLSETIHSVLEQTYPHFELVILENASTDNTVKIIESFDDPRINVQPSDSLLPIEDNWARIMHIESPQEYLVLLCADDILLPTFLEEIVYLIQKEPQATLYHTHAVYINDTNQIVFYGKGAPPVESANEYISAINTGKEDVFGSGYVMRFEDFKRVGGLPSFRRLLFADMYFYYSLASLGYKACVQEILAHYRRTSTGTTNASKIEDFIIAADQYQSALQSHAEFNDAVNLKKFLLTFTTHQAKQQLLGLIKTNSQDKINPSIIVQIQNRKLYAGDFPLRWYIQISQTRIWFVRQLLLYVTLLAVTIRRGLYYIKLQLLRFIPQMMKNNR
ncbi:MAG: glycosyltransferase family 2 protein [Gammaproteobacteria bacterium]|nr:glycosyltransferase family 2 protein [Gammaproteobacteria bacterium]